jgi:hypothetical protein
MTARGYWRLFGALAAPGAIVCAVAAGCEPQDIYLFDEVEETPEPDAGDDGPEPGPDAAPPAFEPPMCDSEACDECVEDGCVVSNFFCHPVTGVCRAPCEPPGAPGAEPACPGGQHCDTSIGLCVDCVGSDDCSDGPLLACDTERGVCVECVGPETCTPDRGICDQTAQECVGCRVDESDCAAGQVCLPDGQRCVQCLVDDDCSGLEDDNRCVPGEYVCGECLIDDDCVAIDPTRPFCRQADHECEDEDEDE